MPFNLNKYVYRRHSGIIGFENHARHFEELLCVYYPATLLYALKCDIALIRYR